MSNLYKLIEELCESRGISVTELCRRSGAARGSLSDLKAGRINYLSTDTLTKIADYFGVSVTYLLGSEKENAHIQMNADEIDFIERSRNLNFEKKEMLRAFLKTLESMP